MQGNGIHDYQGPIQAFNSGFNLSAGASQFSAYMTNSVTYALGHFTLDNAFLQVDKGDVSTTMFRLGKTNPSFLYQKGGTFDTAQDTPYIGEKTNSLACYHLAGGSFLARKDILVGSAAATTTSRPAYGFLIQSGGTFTLTNGTFTLTNNVAVFLPNTGYAHYYQTGGHHLSAQDNTKNQRFALAVNGGTGEWALTGSNTVFETDALVVGGKTAANTVLLALNDGATLKVDRLYRNPLATEMVYMGANGGRLMPTFGYALDDKGGATGYTRAFDHFTLYEKGLIIDTSETYNTVDSTAANRARIRTDLYFHFDAPEGQGLASISFPTDATFDPTAYHTPARVLIEGDGYGASALGYYDPETRSLSHLVIHNPGNNYTQAGTTVKIESPNGKTTFTCPFTLATNKGGPLIKDGTGDAHLFNTNTYSGGTLIRKGKLVAKNALSVPPHTDYILAAGTTLDLCNHPLTMRALEGAGAVNNGTVTVTDDVRVSLADIFAGHHLTLNKSLILQESVRLVILDATEENLQRYRLKSYVPVCTAQEGLSGSLPATIVDAQGQPLPRRWVCSFADNKTLKFGCKKANLIIIR